ncbi:hypothetical protein [Stakelama marina]|nr:hypothetical protein [Stakelama marina]
MRLLPCLLLLPLALTACGQPDTAEGPGGVTVGEAKSLNDAAAMLDANSVSANAVGADQEMNQ